jgi:hypothetical protein
VENSTIRLAILAFVVVDLSRTAASRSISMMQLTLMEKFRSWAPVPIVSLEVKAFGVPCVLVEVSTPFLHSSIIANNY